MSWRSWILPDPGVPKSEPRFSEILDCLANFIASWQHLCFSKSFVYLCCPKVSKTLTIFASVLATTLESWLFSSKRKSLYRKPTSRWGFRKPNANTSVKVSKEQKRHVYEAYKKHYEEQRGLALRPNVPIRQLEKIFVAVPRVHLITFADFMNHAGNDAVQPPAKYSPISPMSRHISTSCLFPDFCKKIDSIHWDYNRLPWSARRWNPVKVWLSLMTIIPESRIPLRELSMRNKTMRYPTFSLDFRQITKRLFNRVTSIMATLTALNLCAGGSNVTGTPCGEGSEVYHLLEALQAARNLKYLRLLFSHGDRITLATYQVLMRGWALPQLQILVLIHGLFTGAMLIESFSTMKVLWSFTIEDWELTDGLWSSVIEHCRDQLQLNSLKKLKMSNLDGGLPEDEYGQTFLGEHDSLLGNYLSGKGPNPFGIDGLMIMRREVCMAAWNVSVDEAIETIPWMM